MTTATTAREWPRVRKSPMMRSFEATHGSRDARDLILEVLAKHQRDMDAAAELGIFNTTLSQWIAKLGIVQEAADVRLMRQSASTTANG